MATATKKEVVHIGLLIDESGSMAGNRDSVIQSVNEFVDNLREDAQEKDMRATLAMFDWRYDDNDMVRVKFDDRPFEKCRHITHEDYQPHGSTPLNDAVIKTIKTMGKKVKKGEKTMLVIMTDGQENCSEAKTEDVRKLIAKKEAAGWAFIYLGANQDAWAEGASRGVAQHSSYSFASTPQGTSSTIASTTSRASFYASSDNDTYTRASKNMSNVTGGKLEEGVVMDLADFAPDKEKDKEDQGIEKADK